MEGDEPTGSYEAPSMLCRPRPSARRDGFAAEQRWVFGANWNFAAIGAGSPGPTGSCRWSSITLYPVRDQRGVPRVSCPCVAGPRSRPGQGAARPNLSIIAGALAWMGACAKVPQGKPSTRFGRGGAGAVSAARGGMAWPALCCPIPRRRGTGEPPLQERRRPLSPAPRPGDLVPAS